MAKTIKFNLRIDGNLIRTIEDLQANFVIDDLVKYYDNGLLLKWLSVRGYDEQKKKLQSIIRTDDKSLVKSMIEIFEMPVQKKKYDEELYCMEYEKEQLRALKNINNMQTDMNNIIFKYHDDYEKCISRLIEEKDNYPSVKATLNMIVRFYRRLFRVDVVRLFSKLKDEAPLAIFAMLMNDELREELKSVAHIWKEIEKLHQDAAIISKLGPNLVRFAGETEGYWKNLRDIGNKYMVISMPSGSLVGSPEDNKIEYPADEVNGKYLIFNGLIYKSNNRFISLVYMEV